MKRLKNYYSRNFALFGYSITLTTSRIVHVPPRSGHRWQILWHPLGVGHLPPRVVGSARTKIGANRVARRVAQACYYGADVKPGNTIEVRRAG